jgi:hypothetical protein
MFAIILIVLIIIAAIVAMSIVGFALHLLLSPWLLLAAVAIFILIKFRGRSHR